MPPETPNRASLSTVRCVGYVRVSTERQAGEVYTSLADQDAAIRVLASRLGLTVEHWYRDEGASGATVAKRPAFRQLLADCVAAPRGPGAPGYVLVLNDSRFGRFPDPDEAAALRFELKRHGWLVRFCEGDDSQDVTSRSIMRAVGSAQASEYRRNLQLNSRRGKKGTASQGFWTTRPPFGYARKVVYPPAQARVLAPGVDKAKNEKIVLVPDPAEAEVVRWLFEAYAAGSTLGALLEPMREKAPRCRWSRSALAGLLRNPAYLGHVVGGKRAPLDPMERLMAPPKTPADWYGKEHAHEALVTPELFARVARRLTENQRIRLTQRRGASPYILSGLLRCALCGAAYTGGGSSHANAGKARPFLFYKDTGGVKDAHRAAICAGPVGTVAKHLVEATTLDVLATTMALASTQRAIRAQLDTVLGANLAGRAAAIARVVAERQQLTARRDRVVAAMGDGTLTADEASATLLPLRARLAALAQEEHQLRTAAPATSPDDVRAAILAPTTQFREVYDFLTPGEQRDLLRAWLGSLTFDKHTRTLTVGIRPLPDMDALLPYSLGPQAEPQQRTYIVRSVIIPSWRVPHRARVAPRQA